MDSFEAQNNFSVELTQAQIAPEKPYRYSEQFLRWIAMSVAIAYGTYELYYGDGQQLSSTDGPNQPILGEFQQVRNEPELFALPLQEDN